MNIVDYCNDIPITQQVDVSSCVELYLKTSEIEGSATTTSLVAAFTLGVIIGVVFTLGLNWLSR